MLVVGLTGGIGSGKSTVGRLLAEHGAVVIDADVLAREVVGPGTPGLAAVLVEFGPDVLTAAGELDRAALGARVFDDEAARKRLESIVHPRVRARAGELQRAAEAAGVPVIVHDIPLLVESGQATSFDAVVVVDAPPDVQVERLAAQRAMSAAQAQARISAQATRADRLDAADYVVSNAGSLEQLAADVETLWLKLTAATPRAAPTGEHT